MEIGIPQSKFAKLPRIHGWPNQLSFSDAWHKFTDYDNNRFLRAPLLEAKEKCIDENIILHSLESLETEYYWFENSELYTENEGP
jgi:hypothetical protein